MSCEFKLLTTPSLITQLNFPNTDGALLAFVNKRMLQQLPPADSKCQKISRNVIKSFAGAISIAGKIPFVVISLKLGERLGSNVLGGFLAYGNTASFSLLIIWAMLRMIDDSVGPKGEEEKRLLEGQISKCYRLAILASSVTLGVIAQFPVAYVAYAYNKGKAAKIYMPALILGSESWVSSYSAYLSFFRLAEQTCRRSPFETHLTNIKANVIKRIECNRMRLTDLKTRSIYLNFLSNYSTTALTEKSLEFFDLMTQLPIEVLNKTNNNMKPIDKLISFIGLTFTVSQMFIYGLVSYEGATKFWKNPYFGATASALVVGTNAYLSGMAIPKTAIRFCRTSTDVIRCRYKKSLSAQLRPNFSLMLTLVGLATAFLSLGPSIEIPHDYIKEKKFRLYLEITMPCAIVLLASMAILDIIDDLAEWQTLHFGNVKEKQLLNLNYNMKKFSDLIDKSSFLEFSRLLSLLSDDVLGRFVNDTKETKQSLDAYLRNTG